MPTTYMLVLLAVAGASLGRVVGAAAAAAEKDAAPSPGKLRNAAETATAAGDYKAALNALDKVIHLEPDNERNFYKRARVFHRMKKTKDAVQDCANALKLKPEWATALALKAKLQLGMGRCVEARQDLERLHEIDPTHAQLKTFEEVTRCAQHVNNAHEYDRLNDKGSMVRELRMALELTDGSAAELMMWCVGAHLDLGDYYEAIADAGRVIKLEPTNIEALALRGRAYFELADMDMALNHWRGALKLDPEHEFASWGYKHARKITKRVASGDAALEKGDAAGAVADWRRALAMAPEHALFCGPLLLRVSNAHAAAQQWGPAADAAQESLNVVPDVLDAYLALGAARLSLDDFDRSIAAYRKARELDGNSQAAADGQRKAEVALKQSKEKNYYKILGVARNANDKEVKKAYRKAALEFHPDRHATESEEVQERMETKFQDAAEAYEVLSDADMRARYDRGEDVMKNGGGGGGGGGQRGGGFGFPPGWQGQQRQHFHQGGGQQRQQRGGQQHHFRFG